MFERWLVQWMGPNVLLFVGAALLVSTVTVTVWALFALRRRSVAREALARRSMRMELRRSLGGHVRRVKPPVVRRP